jgi:uncharacterized protein (DUF1684 family)
MLDGGPLGAGPLGELWDWRRRVSEIYAAIRQSDDPAAAWLAWRVARDGLFRDHPQSALEPGDRAGFTGLTFFAYDPAFRFIVGLTPAMAEVLIVPAGGDGDMALRPFARTEGLATALGRELTLYWVEGYGGGVLLPFADATSGKQTYGAGRYVLDTIKGADLGSDGSGRIVIDFNFAYNPSCSYSNRFVCPLAPPQNRLSMPVRAGEQTDVR